jgi:hypothetical protein
MDEMDEIDVMDDMDVMDGWMGWICATFLSVKNKNQSPCNRSD